MANMTAEPESLPIAGVQATVENSGGVGGCSTLTRTLVPGAHGWQKKVDARESFLIITGPSFQWAVKVEPALSTFARDFAAKVTGAGNAAAARSGHPAAPGQQPAAPIAMDELRELAELRDAGIVSPQEFEATKARLLGSVTRRNTAEPRGSGARARSASTRGCPCAARGPGGPGSVRAWSGIRARMTDQKEVNPPVPATPVPPGRYCGGSGGRGPQGDGRPASSAAVRYWSRWNSYFSTFAQ